MVANKNDLDGHGTHLASCALGCATSDIVGEVVGAAPEAELVVQGAQLESGAMLLPDDLNEILAPPYEDDGARIFNGSWNQDDSQAIAAYTLPSRSVDDFVHAARDAVVCLSVGNDGAVAAGTTAVAHGSILPPATAKNCITVGASENVRPEIKAIYSSLGASFGTVIGPNGLADCADGMAAFSSRGPVQDGRFKPDVVAPGTSILERSPAIIRSSHPRRRATRPTVPTVSSAARARPPRWSRVVARSFASG